MPGFNECWRCQRRSTEVSCSRCEVAKYCSKKCQERDQWRHKSDCDAAAVARTCNSCGKVSTNLKVCSACHQAHYCDRECQRKDWMIHKSRCKTVEQRIKFLAERIVSGPVSRSWNANVLYYWGNYPAFDYLNLEENEGCDYGIPLHVLVFGVGDLRNVAMTCASLPTDHKTKVKFTLNDIEPCTLARLVLLLYMLIRAKDDEANLVTEVWYSTKLTQQTYQSLCFFLGELSRMSSPRQLRLKTSELLEISNEHLNEMKRVWKTWLDLPSLNSEWISKQRTTAFTRDLKSHYGRSSYYQCLPPEHVSSAKQWMEKGVFAPTRIPLVAENPTLTGCPKVWQDSSYCFCLDSSIFPFTGWDYIKVKRFGHCKSLVQMYRAYINNILERFKQTLTSGRISFKAVLENCKQISQYLDPDEKYDRILTSNLSDYISLPHLLKLCSEKLNYSNPYATIVTETRNWTGFHPNADIELNFLNLMQYRERVIKDTGGSSLLKDFGELTFREYYDNTNQFIEFLRALFHAFLSKPIGTEPVRLPSFASLGNEYQLKLRDFRRNENRVAPFKMAVNCRRPTLIRGYERILEWIPMN